MSTKPEGRFPRGALRPPLPSAPPCKRVPPWRLACRRSCCARNPKGPTAAPVCLGTPLVRGMAQNGLALGSKRLHGHPVLANRTSKSLSASSAFPPWAGFRLRTPPLARFARSLIRSYPRAAVPARNPRMWEFRRRGGAGGAAKSAVLLPPRLVLDAAVLCGLRRPLTLPALRTPRAESTCQLFSVLKSEPPGRILTSHLV